MGSPLEEPGRYADEGAPCTVTIGRFAAARYETTRREWSAFVAATQRPEPQVSGNTYCDWRSPRFTQDNNHPVVCVSWNDAADYVRWLSERTREAYRLLTEAEWEYAARAGTVAPYWIGASLSRQHANFGRKGTRPVGSYPPNAFGLADTSGNVWEWVQDCYHRSYLDAPSDGSAWLSEDCSRRVLRSGSWGANPLLLRSAARYRYGPSLRFNSGGFRVARTLEEP